MTFQADPASMSSVAVALRALAGESDDHRAHLAALQAACGPQVCGSAVHVIEGWLGRQARAVADPGAALRALAERVDQAAATYEQVDDAVAAGSR